MKRLLMKNFYTDTECHKHHKDQVVNEYAPLIRMIAASYAAKLPPSIELDDLVSVATLGLLDAIDKFDPTQKTTFKRYAEYRIRGSILDELRSLDIVSRNVRQKQKVLLKATRHLEQKHNRPVSQEEVRSELKLSKNEFHTLRKNAVRPHLISLDQPSLNDNYESTTIKDSIPDTNKPRPDSELLNKEMKQKLADCLEELPENQRIALTLYYFESLNLREIAQVLELTESRVCQLHQKAIETIRNLISENDEMDFVSLAA